MSCLDEGIGRVLTALDDAGVSDDIIVWFLSDNGGVERNGASNDPLRGGKRTVREGGVRVPAIVRWPRGGLDGGRTNDALMGYIDVAPILRRMIGARRPVFRPFDGIDVLDVLTGRSREPRREWFTYRYQHWSFTPEHMAITTNTWKLIRRGGSILMDPNFETPVELYRIWDDPTDPDPAPPLDRSRSGFSEAHRRPATAPGCRYPSAQSPRLRAPWNRLPYGDRKATQPDRMLSDRQRPLA